MKRKITLGVLLIILFFSHIVKAAVPVSGRIIEKTTGNPLEYANILLLSLPDSAFVTGATSEGNGAFQFDNVNSGKYLLKVLYIGLETQFIPLQVLTEPIILGDIQLNESNALKEVVVTAKTPPFQSSINGGIIANVATTLLSTVGTANDVLQRIPGLTADNGKVSVFGKETPIVYINNRKIQDMSELERLESSEISTVELITNPGAKYDAEGRAVLLIKTKSKKDGFSAQAIERLWQGKYLGDNENISISYTKDKMDLFVSYYHNYVKKESTENHYLTLNNTEGVWQYNTPLNNRWDNHTQQASAGLDYSINDKQAVGGQYQYNTSKMNDVQQITSQTLKNGAFYESTYSPTDGKDNDYQHLVNAFYNGDFSERYSLHFDFDYMKYHNDREQYSNETIFTATDYTESRDIEIFNQTDYNLYASKLTNSLKSRWGLVEFGGEWNYITGNGFVRSNGYTDNTEFTNTEQKAAGFVSYSHKLAGVNVVAGLRYEFTSEHYTEGSDKKPVIDRTYSDLYPNISLSGQVKGVDLSLAFNKRTQRPSFEQLNGNVVYINPFVFQKGDPYLNKSNIYDLNLQATLKPFYLNIGYYYAKNPVLLFLEEQEDNTILSTSANFPKYQNLNATLNWSGKMKFWQPNYTAGVEQPFFSAMYNGQMMNYNKVDYFFMVFNDFLLPQGFVLSCNFRYRSDIQDALFESKSYQRIDLGLRKSFFKNTLRLNLMVYDIFNWVKDKNRMQINNIDWTADKKYETRYATLSITYLFNNYKKKYRGSSAAPDDLNRF